MANADVQAARPSYPHNHPGRLHHWFKYAWEPESARRCDMMGCHARPEDVVLDERGYDSGYVTFRPGERRF